MIEDAKVGGQRTENGGRTEDAELLRRYAEEKSEAAFAELVTRHVGFVHACALRRVGGDAHTAQDVTQAVFTALARHAARLQRHEALSGWLFTATRNAAAQVVRGARRRQGREQEAQIMNEILSAPGDPTDWERLRPVLDGALDELNEDDRQAVLWRFFEGKSFAEIGGQLRLTGNAARMRVERALDKLHALLARRGVTSTTAALGLALANQVGAAVPAGLAASVAATALTGANAVGAGTVTAGGMLNLMSTTKTMVGVAGALMALAGITGVYYHQQRRADEAARAVGDGRRVELQAKIASLEKRVRQAERRAQDAEKDSSELLKAVESLRAANMARPTPASVVTTVRAVPSSAEQDRWAQERAYQQELARKREEERRQKSELEEEASRLDPAGKFNRLIEAAEQLAAKGEFETAIRTYNEAMIAKPGNLPVSDKVRQLQALLKAQNGRAPARN